MKYVFSLDNLNLRYNIYIYSSLIREQQNDPEISALYQKSSDEMDAAGGLCVILLKTEC